MHSRFEHGGRPRGRRGSTVAVGLAVLVLVAAACGGARKVGSPAAISGPSSTSAGSGTAQSTGSGAAGGEGPYPWKYPGSGSVAVGSGTTVSGTKCSPGTPQFPYSYAPPCVAAFHGSNGGATYNGVTGNEILLANLVFPSTSNSAEVAAVAKQDGAALPEVTDQVRKVFLDYFNKVYELYGRHVVIQDVAATGNSTEEALDEDQAQACADADTVAHSVHAFGEVGIGDNFTGGGGSGPFSVCAAQQKLVEFQGGAYYDEAWYQQYNPYIWAEAQDCERIANTSAEVIAKLLAGHPARYAGDPSLQKKTRKLGTYIPNLPQYLTCNKMTQSELESKYHVAGVTDSVSFTYGLDISTFQQSAQQAMVQFKAAGVTTVVAACDPYSLQLLTKAAAAQNYHPEWMINGAALNDLDSVAQSFDSSEVDGHLFGLSELSPEQELEGPTSTPGKLYQHLTGAQIPALTDGGYYALVYIFDLLQAAGPDLTPQNMARGAHALPVLGSPLYEAGRWSFNLGPDGGTGQGDHTAVADARFVYWDGGAASPVNGKPGTWVSVFGGKRFLPGQWPTTLPALFTQAGSG